MRNFVCTTAALCFAAGSAIGAEWPDPNPAPNGDGTNTWYVGNNTQYPIIQDVLDACGDGDEIVVADGLYVESLSIDNNDVTLRPFCNDDGEWDDVTFWNPTEGFENDNEYAMYVTGGNNTYVGRPRMLTQLPNTNVVTTMIQPGEWDPSGAPVDVQDVAAVSGPAMTFWSRSIDNVAIYSVDGLATFQDCEISSSDSFGGGAMITGDANTTQFVNCLFHNTYAGGQAFDLNGEPVCVVTIIGGEAQFHGCGILGNEAGAAGVVHQRGGGGIWYACDFADNFTMSGEGMYRCEGGTPAFNDCTFAKNESREGTIYFNSTGVEGARFMNFSHCNFEGNYTSGAQYGGAVQVVCDDCAGDAPEISFSDCGFDGNNGNMGLGLYDIDSPYFPEYRIAGDIDDSGLVTDAPSAGEAGDINADGLVNTTDLEALFAMLGTCSHDSDYSGDVQIGDLLELIAVYGTSCH